MSSKGSVGGVEAPIKADFEQIPIPPEGASGDLEKTVTTSRAPDEVAVLDFVDGAAMTSEVVIDNPFRWDGRVVDKVVVRMPTFVDIVRVYENAPKDADGDVKLIEFYAVMSGLPAPVLRALPYADYERIVASCSPFLPRALTASAST